MLKAAIQRQLQLAEWNVMMLLLLLLDMSDRLPRSGVSFSRVQYAMSSSSGDAACGTGS